MPDVTTDAERVVTEYLRVINEREFSTLSDLLAESFTFRSPTAGTVRGRGEFELYLREIVDGFSAFHVSVEEILADENLVMTESTVTGTHDGEFEGIPPTHRDVEFSEMATFVVERGTLREERAYYDYHEVLRQLGLIDE